ncbi:MAG: sigma-70 family RNA polymerase sigma factor [Oscillospiraceae bacterium]|nr:sigma-70 family RNA polymerase sigma factor [Oscillospiraceae bacterium]
MNDEEIIELFWARSEQAIPELTRRYGGAIRRVAANILADAQDVEECVNDTYLQLWNSIPPQRPRFLGAFACTVARNLSLNRCHANTAQKRGGGYDAALDELAEVLPTRTSVEAEYEAKELASCIGRFLRRQTYEDRYLFLRRYWYGDAVTEIAERMGLKPHAVSVRLFRIREKLERFLEKEGMLI